MVRVLFNVNAATLARTMEIIPGMSMEQLLQYTGSTNLKIEILCQNTNLLTGTRSVVSVSIHVIYTK